MSTTIDLWNPEHKKRMKLGAIWRILRGLPTAYRVSLEVRDGSVIVYPSKWYGLHPDAEYVFKFDKSILRFEGSGGNHEA